LAMKVILVSHKNRLAWFLDYLKGGHSIS